jgi:hypothetical protein
MKKLVNPGRGSRAGVSRVLAVAACVSLRTPSASAQTLEQQCLRQLLTVRRVYVDQLGGGETAGQMRDMIIGSLLNSRLFLITENQDRADAVLRGSAEDMVFTDIHQSSDGITARAGVTSSSSRSIPGANFTVGQQESQRSAERRHEALASVRLVNKEGDVIWATTQESLGAKFRGSSADVAEKITRQLGEDFEKARKLQ